MQFHLAGDLAVVHSPHFVWKSLEKLLKNIQCLGATKGLELIGLVWDVGIRMSPKSSFGDLNMQPELRTTIL